MYKVCSIIITFNGEKWIEKCLNSLINSSIKSKIIVVDNNSADNTTSLIKEKYPDVHFIQLNDNLGFGKANNIGLRKAFEDNVDYVLLLNQDSWISPDSLEQIIKQFESNPEYGIIAPVNMNTDASNLETGFQAELTPGNCPGFISDSYVSKIRSLYEIKNYINASCWLISKKCLHIVGGFDPLFSHYGEDVNYCMRARFHGFKVGLSTLTHSIHAKDNYIQKSGKLLTFIKKERTKYINNYLLIKLTNPKLHYIKLFFEELFILVLLSLKSIIKPRYFLLYTLNFFFLIAHFFLILRNRKLSKNRTHAFI